MKENTVIKVYGDSLENKDNIEQEFDWGTILSSSELFVRSPYNPRIFSIKNTCDIAAYGKRLGAHPGGTNIFEMVQKVSTQIVANYYKCSCIICGNHELLSTILLTDASIELVMADANQKDSLDIFLACCALLFVPEHSKYYAVIDEKGNVSERTDSIPIPNYLPASYEALFRNCTSLIYSLMMECLRDKSSYPYPNFDEMEQRIDQLSIEECMQYFLYYNRLSLRYGQQYFFLKWSDGTALRVVKRIQQLQRNTSFYVLK